MISFTFLTGTFATVLRKGRGLWEARVEEGRPLRRLLPCSRGAMMVAWTRRDRRRWWEVGGICVILKA